MTDAPPSAAIAVGDELPPFELNVTSTVIVAGAIASRDFMPAHHDPVFARAQGAPDMFMNILTTNGYVSRFVTDWAGPEALLRSVNSGRTWRAVGRVMSVPPSSGACKKCTGRT